MTKFFLAGIVMQKHGASFPEMSIQVLLMPDPLLLSCHGQASHSPFNPFESKTAEKILSATLQETSEPSVTSTGR